MNQPIQISNAWVAAMIAALMFDILYPLALGVFARRRWTSAGATSAMAR